MTSNDAYWRQRIAEENKANRAWKSGRLSEKQQKTLISELKVGTPQTALAERFGLSRRTVSEIAQRHGLGRSKKMG